MIGTALFVTLAALIAYGLGAIIRHTAGAIATAIGLLFVLQLVVQFLPSSWRWDVMRFLPYAAGEVVTSTVGFGNQHLWSAWPQLGVTAIWAMVLVAIGAYLFRKRDA
jgi:ABC-2 type transport system permease protein